MFQKPIHKVKLFCPGADGFTQALLVMLVTNIMSAPFPDWGSCTTLPFGPSLHIIQSLYDFDILDQWG